MRLLPPKTGRTGGIYTLKCIKVLNLHNYAYRHAAFCHVFVAAHHSILCEWCDGGRGRVHVSECACCVHVCHT